MKQGNRSTRPKFTEATTGSRRPTKLRLAIACGSALTVLAAPAVAETAQSYANEPFRLSVDELRELRGGVIVNGVHFDFGAVIQLRVSGELAAETTVTMNQDGSMSRSTEIFNNSIVTEFTDPSQLAGTNIQLNGPNGSVGFLVKDSNGVSIALNNVNAGHLFGLLANGAAGRDISHSIEATLTIHNFSQINAGLMSDIAAGRAMAASAPDMMLQ